MTKKDLKHLNRRELLQMLLLQVEENERLKEDLAEARELLEERRIEISEAGSIAEAALRLHDIFDAAQAAADTYLENVRALGTRRRTQAWEAPDVSDLWKD